MSDLEQSIRRLNDRAELHDLMVRYFMASDDDDYEALGECFTEDGEFRAGDVAGGATREEVVEGIRQARQSMGLTVHTPNYQLLEFDGDARATGVVGAHLELCLAGQGLFGAVRYFDEYERRDDRWRLRKRIMRTVHIGPWAEAAETLTSDRPVRWPGADPAASEL